MLNLTSEQRKLIALLAQEELARRSYKDYVEYVHHGQYTHFRHTELICNELQPIVDGEQRFIIIEMPPRHGKSMTVTETFPSFFIAKNPNKRVITAAYSDGLATKFGRVNRNKFKEFAPALFDLRISDSNSATKNWGVEGHTGGMIATGIGGSITGQGADCFPSGTMIETEIGLMDIVDLVEMKKPPRVLSFDHKTSTLAYKKILARRKKQANEFTRVTTASGNQVISTRDHRFYTHQRGYWEASFLRYGDRFTTYGIKKKYSLQSMWSGKRRPRFFLQTLLPAIQKIIGHFRMYPLQKALRKGTLRIYEGCQKRTKGFLLLKGMFRKSPCSKKHKALSHLWWKKTSRQQVLFGMCQESKTKQNIKTNRMSRMRNYFSTPKLQNSLLFKRLCRQSPFKKNGGRRKFQIQGWKKLCELVQRNAPDYFGARFVSLCRMFKGRENYDLSTAGESGYTYQSDSASYRRGCKKQSSRQSDYDVSTMPYHSSQISSDTVSRVENFSGRTEPVYDIQVEGTSNFFANNILVHNCLIIDDPIKNAKEAASQTIRDNIWDEWESTLSTRLHNGASVIVIMTRWHEDDIIGRLLDRSPRNWVRLRLPAIAEDEDDLLGREVGEALCPELGFDEQWAEDKKSEVGSRTWASLFQQRPSPAGGSIFSKHWWKFYVPTEEIRAKLKLPKEVAVLPKLLDKQVQSWDCTFKDSSASDFVVGQVWGRRQANSYLLDQIRDRLNLPETMKAIRNMTAKWPNAKAKYVEDKANGPAVIQMLQDEISGLIPVNPEGGKEVRANAVSPEVESGNVYLPHPLYAPWVNELIDEATAFPNGKHDDMVDSLTQALVKLQAAKGNPLDRYKKLMGR